MRLGPLRWSSRPGLTRGRESYVCLLDADDDLAEELDVRAQIAARQFATVTILDAEVGERDPERWFQAIRKGPGLLILDGLIAFTTCVGDRTATELIGDGDLLQPPATRADCLLAREHGWRVLSPTRFALLDAEFAERVSPWPQIVQALLRRGARRIADIDMLRAITCQPRLELRLVLLLWHLAARWGRVDPGGIRVSLPLTHRLLGQLVGAERPSISHALGRLANAGLMTGAADDLHLHGSLEDHLKALVERASAPEEQPEPNGATASAPGARLR